MSHGFEFVLMAISVIGAPVRSQEKVATASSPEALRRIERHKDWTWAVALSPDEWQLLSSSGDPDRTARVWDFATGKALRNLERASGINDVVWLPDGRCALLAGSGRDWFASVHRLHDNARMESADRAEAPLPGSRDFVW
jgi:WD40 repeat protein